jgi:hypothetical protein
VRTHPVDKLLEQHCYKSAAGLLQLARFYVCKIFAGSGHVTAQHLRGSHESDFRYHYKRRLANQMRLIYPINQSDAYLAGERKCLVVVEVNRQFPLQTNFKTRQGDANRSPQLERAY